MPEYTKEEKEIITNLIKKYGVQNILKLTGDLSIGMPWVVGGNTIVSDQAILKGSNLQISTKEED